jgi:hypothetical protein
MKLQLLAMLLCTAGVVSAADDAVKPAPRPRLTEELRRQAIEQSPVRREGASEAKSPEVKAAEKRAEVAQYSVMALGHGLISRSTAPSPGSRPYTLREGGTYWVRNADVFTTESMVLYDPANRGWDLFRISW